MGESQIQLKALHLEGNGGNLPVKELEGLIRKTILGQKPSKEL